MIFRPGQRVAAIYDVPASRPFEISVVKGGIYEVEAFDEELGSLTLIGDRPGRWLSALGFRPEKEARR